MAEKDGRMNWTERVVSAQPGWSMWAAVIVLVVFSLWFFSAGPYATMADHGGIPDEDFWNTPSAVEARVAAMNETVQQDYTTFLGADFVFAAVYGGAMLGLITQASILFLPSRFWHVVWLPIGGAAADILENISMFIVLGGGSAGPFVAFQSVKAVLLGISSALAIAAFLAILVNGALHPVVRKRR